MDSLTVKLYTKKEAQEIINKYRKTTDKVLRMKQIDVGLVENEDVPGTFASKRMYIIIEKIFYIDCERKMLCFSLAYEFHEKNLKIIC